MRKAAQGLTPRRTLEYVEGGKPAEKAAHRKKSHFRVETNLHGGGQI